MKTLSDQHEMRVHLPSTAPITSQAIAPLLNGAHTVNAATLRGKSPQAKTARVLADDTTAAYALKVNKDVNDRRRNVQGNSHDKETPFVELGDDEDKADYGPRPKCR